MRPATDRNEDELLGRDNRGDELPEGLRSREGRPHRLKECKARLEAEDLRARYEAELARRAATQEETGRRLVGLWGASIRINPVTWPSSEIDRMAC